MRKWIDRTLQILLGLIFFVFGLNGFLNFIPEPELSPEVAEFMGALANTGYFIKVVKLVEVVAGLMLLVRRFSALALLFLSPVVVQILLFHIFLEPSGLPMAIVLVLIQAYLGFVVYRPAFTGVLAANAATSTPQVTAR